MLKASRDEVYQALDSERTYQNDRWADGANHNPHSITEWLTYMRVYAEEGLRIVSTSSDEQGGLPFARKVAALGVVCMEQHGAPRREGY